MMTTRKQTSRCTFLVFAQVCCAFQSIMKLLLHNMFEYVIFEIRLLFKYTVLSANSTNFTHLKCVYNTWGEVLPTFNV